MSRAIQYKPLRQILLALCLMTASATAVYAAGIAGSKHDLSSKDWGTNEICRFCHTPHNADKTIADSPLWNHKVTVATYTVYSSPTMDPRYPVEQPRGPSKLCLSCHDGTVAIDSYASRTGNQFMTGPAKLGTDLSNDHPISFKWAHQDTANGNCTSCHVMHGGGELKPNLPLKDGYIECISCHDAHNKYPHTKMLRYNIALSELCLKCHAK